MGVEREQLDTQEKTHINVPTVANTNTSCVPATVPSTFHVITHKSSPHIYKVDANVLFEEKLAERSHQPGSWSEFMVKVSIYGQAKVPQDPQFGTQCSLPISGSQRSAPGTKEA